jgi:hypothetical protein
MTTKRSLLNMQAGWESRNLDATTYIVEQNMYQSTTYRLTGCPQVTQREVVPLGA